MCLEVEALAGDSRISSHGRWPEWGWAQSPQREPGLILWHDSNLDVMQKLEQCQARFGFSPCQPLAPTEVLSRARLTVVVHVFVVSCAQKCVKATKEAFKQYEISLAHPPIMIYCCKPSDFANAWERMHEGEKFFPKDLMGYHWKESIPAEEQAFKCLGKIVQREPYLALP